MHVLLEELLTGCAVSTTPCSQKCVHKNYEYNLICKNFMFSIKCYERVFS